MVKSTSFLVVGCLLSSSALAASVYESRPAAINEAVPKQSNFVKESKFNAPPPPVFDDAQFADIFKSLKEGMSKDGKVDIKSMTEKMGLTDDQKKKAQEAMKGGNADFSALSESLLKDGKFDFKSMAEKLPKEFLNEEVLKKSAEAFKDGKYDFNGLDMESILGGGGKGLKDLLGEGNGLQDLLGKGKNLFGGAGKDFDFGSLLGNANPEARDANFAKMMESFKEQQEKAKAMLEEAKKGNKKFDWRELFGGPKVAVEEEEEDSDDFDPEEVPGDSEL